MGHVLSSGVHAKPWRRFEEGGAWTKEYRNKLIQDIRNLDLHGNLTSVKIGVFGYCASGKSSFVNSVCSIDRGRLSGFAIVSRETTSPKIHIHKTDRSLGEIRFVDTMGFVDGSQDQRIEFVRKIFQGYRHNYSAHPIEETSDQDNIEPVLADMCHGVVLILDATKTLSMTNSFLQEFISNVRHDRVPMILVLTKIDLVCPTVSNDITKTFESSILEKYVNHVRDLTGVPILNIYPVKNYSHEMGLDTNMDILILTAVRHIVGLADDFVKQMEDENADSETVHQE